VLDLFFILKGGQTLDSRDKALDVARAALDKKAKDVIVLDLQGLSTITDYFVICSGESTTQVKAIEEQIEDALKKKGVRPVGVEGLGYSHWVLMDYGDVIAHIFEESTRAFYELEKLWIDAKKVDL